QKIRQERKQVQDVADASKDKAALGPELSKQLKDVRSLHREVTADLRRLPSGSGQELAQNEMARADRALTRAQDPNLGLDQRDEELARADLDLFWALKRLEEMSRGNQHHAEERFTQQKLDKLAGRQKDLAKEAGDVAKEAK